MALWYECGRGLVKMPTSFAKANLNSDVYFCCPGPSLANVKDSDLHIPGAMTFALNTAYPHIRPDIWVGMDYPECYDRNLWWEPFIKITRGGHSELKIGVAEVKHAPNVFYADTTKGKIEDIFSRRGHEDPFVWMGNSFASALHIMVWMGAKQINLLGCDFGGDKDYYDDRELSAPNRNRNRNLYKQQVEFLREFTKQANQQGINVTSCTPKSPINKFVEYVDLQDALEISKSKVPKAGNSWVYATEAAHCRWDKEIKHDKGVIVGVAKIHQDFILWWIENYKKHNDYPIVFADFGMSPQYKKLCKMHGEVIDATTAPVAGWFRKPFAILKAPFRKILWCDTDIEIRRNVGELFAYSNDGKLGVGWDSWNPDSFRDNVPDEAKLWDSGLISVEHGNVIINDWAETIMADHPDKYHGDHEVLSIKLWEHGMPIREFPKTVHRMRIDPEADKFASNNLISMHWTGPSGKRHIRDTMIEKGVTLK